MTLRGLFRRSYEMPQPDRRPRLAAIVNVFQKHYHAQHIVDRFLDGYGWDGTYHMPPMDLISLYVDQVGPHDVSRERLLRHPTLKLYPTVEDAITLGGSKLAVDGIVVVGEHGDYPKNELGQTEYPRYQYFDRIVNVFRSSGRTVPYFNDKHLSWNYEWAQRMVSTAHSMGFALQAGSSLPVTWRIPSIDMPYGAKVREAVAICYGGIDSYDFHGLETIQCMVERRAGGETGVEWLQAYRGEAFWNAMEEGVWSRKLMNAALCRSHTLGQARPSFNDRFPTSDEMRSLVKDPIAYTYQHTNGPRCTMMLMNGLVRDFNFAATLDGRSDPLSVQMYLPMPDGRTTLANFFSPLVNHMETLFLSGKAAYPIERTLLTTGLTAAGCESLFRGKRIQTPWLNVAYTAPTESLYWRS